MLALRIISRAYYVLIPNLMRIKLFVLERSVRCREEGIFEKIMNKPGKIRLIDRDKRKEETGSAVSKATG